MRTLILSVLVIALLSSCKKEVELPIEFTYEFDQGPEGWVAGFADYPEGEDEFYELASGVSSLPNPLPLAPNAFMLEGNNHSDDLFMFMKKKLSGFDKNKVYKIRFFLDFASNAAEESIGIGGSPAHSVYIKSGAIDIEPIAVVDDSDGWYRMNIDNNNQSQGGDDMIVLGDFSNGTDKFEYTMVSLSNEIPFEFKTDENGECWIIIGVDSGFEGKTSIYFDRIHLIIEK